MASFGTYDFNNRIVVISARRVDRNSSRLIDHDHTIILVQYTNWVCADWGFVSVQHVRYHVAVLDYMMWTRNRLSINNDGSTFYSILLAFVSYRITSKKVI